MAHTVLVVDDEIKLCDVTEMFLEAENIAALKAHTGEDALRLFDENEVDLVILDVMLPDMSGIDVCRSIRRRSEVPILFLSALSDDECCMLGYRAGADDYIAKPFSEALLMMKVNRILATRAQTASTRRADARGLALDVGARRCCVDGAEIHLTPLEFDLLHALMKNEGSVVTREELLRSVWGYDFLGNQRMADTHVMNLRKKLGDAASQIVTVMSIGYKYEAKERP